MVLADTSTWIDYFRGRETIETFYLTDLIAEKADLCISGVILAEILQGIASERQYKSVDHYLQDLIYLPMSRSAYIRSADIYRKAKAHGAIIRSTIDCLIAACAIEHSVPLLQNDKDYLTIAKYSSLKILDPGGK